MTIGKVGSLLSVVGLGLVMSASSYPQEPTGSAAGTDGAVMGGGMMAMMESCSRMMQSMNKQAPQAPAPSAPRGSAPDGRG